MKIAKRNILLVQVLDCILPENIQSKILNVIIAIVHSLFKEILINITNGLAIPNEALTGLKTGVSAPNYAIAQPAYAKATS